MDESVTRQRELAESLARRVHHGIKDKSGAPYIDHPRRVAAKLAEPRAQVVAWLHDVLEDTETSEDELRVQFDGTIMDAVVALTKIEGEAPESYYARVRANGLALQVKLADIHDNLDPARLALLDAPTANGFMAKYGRALMALSGEQVIKREA